MAGVDSRLPTERTKFNSIHSFIHSFIIRSRLAEPALDWRYAHHTIQSESEVEGRKIGGRASPTATPPAAGRANGKQVLEEGTKHARAGRAPGSGVLPRLGERLSCCAPFGGGEAPRLFPTPLLPPPRNYGAVIHPDPQIIEILRRKSPAPLASIGIPKVVQPLLPAFSPSCLQKLLRVRGCWCRGCRRSSWGWRRLCPARCLSDSCLASAVPRSLALLAAVPAGFPSSAASSEDVDGLVPPSPSPPTLSLSLPLSGSLAASATAALHSFLGSSLARRSSAPHRWEQQRRRRRR